MVYSYTPTYYSSLHDSITSLCKTVLPFSFKKKRLPAADHKLSKLQSDNLKWQQDSFHQILNLMGLHKEAILAEHEVSAFRSHLLETLIASPAECEQPVILRDKLLFLQELLYSKCISAEEYHSSKRPLLQRLAVQGAEIDTRDVIVEGPNDPKENTEEEWSVIDLKEDEKCMIGSSNSKTKSKHVSAVKQIKGAASVLGFVSSHKPGKNSKEKSIFDSMSQPKATSSASGNNETEHFKENPFWNGNLNEKESETRSILMPESLPVELVKPTGSTEKAKRRPFRTLFHSDNNGANCEEKMEKSAKKQWGFEGFKKWKRGGDSEDETAPLPLYERSDNEAYLGTCRLVSSPVGEGPDTKQIKKKLHSDGSSSDFFIDKVLGDKIKKELCRIQTELSTSNPNLKFSNDQIEAISTKLPVEKGDLKKFFPKYGDVVLDVVKKEFKEHVGEMENLRNAAREKHSTNNNSMHWTTFEDDENCHPNLFAHQNHNSIPINQQSFTPVKEEDLTRSYQNNPFFQDFTESNEKKQRSATYFQDHNPFWSPRHGSSMLG